MTREAFYPSPLGCLRICYREDLVVSISYVTTYSGPGEPSPASDNAATQILEYFSGTRKTFDFPMECSGTDFQRKVWHALVQIPYGQTRTYGQIAASIGQPTAARAVGMACNKNPLWIVVPCHRVIGSNRNLTGYAGGIHMKQALLDLEQQYISRS